MSIWQENGTIGMLAAAAGNADLPANLRFLRSSQQGYRHFSEPVPLRWCPCPSAGEKRDIQIITRYSLHILAAAATCRFCKKRIGPAIIKKVAGQVDLRQKILSIGN